MKLRMLLGLASGLLAIACGPEASPPARPVEAALEADGLSRMERTGQQVFVARCATCHGERGAGDGQNAYTLDPPPPDLGEALPQHPPTYWRDVVLEGTASVGRSPLCPPRVRNLAPREVDAVLAYLAVLARGHADVVD